MIIGTSGHIDHGKTSLVKALTGVDADRLQEEKARGITIDLGFAYKPLPSGDVLGFVDVPGHEKLLRNMLAGATGIDCVLLVVAADDGPMPQTREHLAILDLLGLTRGVVALTKSDLVGAERLAAATGEVESMLRDSGLAGTPVVAVSSSSGAGIAQLDALLAAMAADLPPPAATGRFRLAVDRCFTLGGIGTVVTGTAVSGRVAAGDRLVVSPRGLPARVRGVHAQGRETASGQVGQRLSLNLGSALAKADIERGDWLLDDAVHAPSERIDVRLRLLAGESRALAHWTPVRLHLGACEVGARVVLLEGNALAPGSSALVQLDLERPIGALHGDRFVVRDQSAQRTLGGGAVIDAFAPATRRRRPERLAVLAALEATTPMAALTALLKLEQVGGVDLGWFARLWNLSDDEQAAVEREVAHQAVIDGRLRLAFAPGQIGRFGGGVAEVLSQHHRRAPDSPGLTLEQLRRAVPVKPQAAVFALLIAELVAAGTLRRAGPYLRLARHEATLLAGEQKLWEKIRPWLDEAGLRPQKLGDLVARDRSLHLQQVLQLMLKLARMGKVYAVSNDYFVLPQHMVELALQSQALAEADPQRRLNVKTLRETTGISRHLSVPLVEFFDRIGFTKRDEVGRHIRRDARDLFDGQQQEVPQ